MPPSPHDRKPTQSEPLSRIVILLPWRGQKPSGPGHRTARDQSWFSGALPLDEYGYRKTARLASEKFNRTISSNTIERFAKRAAPKDFLDDSPDAQKTATQILQFAVSGQPQFTEAAVHVLEQTAFKLTFSRTHRAEDMKALQQISTMLFRHRNAAVRERLAKVQEQKIELRREELQGRGILPRKLPPPPPLDPAGTRAKPPNSSSAFQTVTQSFQLRVQAPSRWSRISRNATGLTPAWG